MTLSISKKLEPDGLYHNCIFESGYGRGPPGFISANVRNIYVQEPYVYWISVKGVLWQTNLIDGTPKRRIMDTGATNYRVVMSVYGL